jgi:hypothetical protein
VINAVFLIQPIGATRDLKWKIDTRVMDIPTRPGGATSALLWDCRGEWWHPLPAAAEVEAFQLVGPPRYPRNAPWRWDDSGPNIIPTVCLDMRDKVTNLATPDDKNRDPHQIAARSLAVLDRLAGQFEPW